jgi:hypothetical protein
MVYTLRFSSWKWSLFYNPIVFGSCIIHILYIYSTNIGTEYFKHSIYSPVFPLQNAVCFIILTYLVPVLFTFYIQGVLKLKKNNSGAKTLKLSDRNCMQVWSSQTCYTNYLSFLIWFYWLRVNIVPTLLHFSSIYLPFPTSQVKTSLSVLKRPNLPLVLEPTIRTYNNTKIYFLAFNLEAVGIRRKDKRFCKATGQQICHWLYMHLIATTRGRVKWKP